MFRFLLSFLLQGAILTAQYGYPFPTRRPAPRPAPTTQQQQTADASHLYTYCMVLVFEPKNEFYVTSLIPLSAKYDVNKVDLQRVVEAWRDYVENTMNIKPTQRRSSSFCDMNPSSQTFVTSNRKQVMDRNARIGSQIHEVNWTFDPAKVEVQQAAFSPSDEIPSPKFASAEAQTCWNYFVKTEMKTPDGTASALAACNIAGNQGPAYDPRVNPFQGDPVAQTALAFAYMTGNGVRLNKDDGLKWLEVAARNGGGPGGDCAYAPYFPPAEMMAGVLLWNGVVWWNTDTFHMVWSQPGERVTVARKWISMNEGRKFVDCVVRAQDSRYANLGQKLQKLMPQSQMPLNYNPQYQGTSSTIETNTADFPYADAKSVILIMAFAMGLGKMASNAAKEGKIPNIMIVHDAFGSCHDLMTDVETPCN